VAIAHNSKAFDLLFVLIRLVLMKFLLELLITNAEIMCLKVKNVTWFDSLNYLAMPLRSFLTHRSYGREIEVPSSL
jgi:hypothetical protein